ncbi:acyl-CoA thioesterase [Natrarchaeobius chitinivorans]|uniref:Acyl-CoA thioesterase n=1 Tax=Natrarchaeobius chitinivorans TaxID=1679083 RepID=A0A3N6LWX3_NATCH|nr:acyl-CoA thioesterase [Natrarchaeobius chitinivorans]RQG92224.1 acyl-CoA thioesterase [Natrarchaeobius chitinivorans]
MPTQQPVREETPLQDSFTEMSEILMPNNTNNLGRALGGSVLHWMDICGAIAARRFSRCQVVTAAMDHVDFIAPIELGDIVTITGYVFDTGRTSMDVKVDVRAERPIEGERNEAATSFFSFVALDDTETSTAVPALRCPTESQAKLREHALEQRRERRRTLAETTADKSDT